MARNVTQIGNTVEVACLLYGHREEDHLAFVSVYPLRWSLESLFVSSQIIV